MCALIWTQAIKLKQSSKWRWAVSIKSTETGILISTPTCSGHGRVEKKEKKSSCKPLWAGREHDIQETYQWRKPQSSCFYGKSGWPQNQGCGKYLGAQRCELIVGRLRLTTAVRTEVRPLSSKGKDWGSTSTAAPQPHHIHQPCYQLRNVHRQARPSG